MSTLKNLVDETTNIKNDLVTCHTNLKNNLISKGMEILDSDKIPSLINKVGNIELGKKLASGTIIYNNERGDFFNGFGNKVTGINYIRISGLNFKPRLIFARASNSSGSIFYVSVYKKGDGMYRSSYTQRHDGSNATGTFASQMIGNDVLLPIASSSTGLVWTWDAYE
ncbi:hypothetical protein [Faecalimicrobium sp. JNUCC 81]